MTLKRLYKVIVYDLNWLKIPKLLERVGSIYCSMCPRSSVMSLCFIDVFILFLGNESSLFDCRSLTPGRHSTCTYSNIISVLCAGPDTGRACLDNCSTDAGYFVTSDGVCEPCSFNCLKCAGNATMCTACGKGKTLYKLYIHVCICVELLKHIFVI